jgi:hypothetical protein
MFYLRCRALALLQWVSTSAMADQGMESEGRIHD